MLTLIVSILIITIPIVIVIIGIKKSNKYKTKDSSKIEPYDNDDYSGSTLSKAFKDIGSQDGLY